LSLGIRFCFRSALRATLQQNRTLTTSTSHRVGQNKPPNWAKPSCQSQAVSVRQYERRFLDEVGMTPKLFARTTRFQNALDAKRLFPTLSWMNIAHELGYFDQMHMVRDFQSLGGDAPNNVLEQSGDIQPWSLAPHQTLELK
ncbi:MAG TPA: helix-turn-helix domain-containing protein, partial [Edaphobacter sp.]|nr:helix-turn-helix domain-containing protein [Edaphobacter sp.]